MPVASTFAASPSASSSTTLPEHAVFIAVRLSLIFLFRRLFLRRLVSQARAAARDPLLAPVKSKPGDRGGGPLLGGRPYRDRSPGQSEDEEEEDEERTTQDRLELLPAPASAPAVGSAGDGSNEGGRTHGASFMSKLAGVVFCLSFSESMTLFLIVLLQAADIFETTTRRFHFLFSLRLLLFLLTILIPLLTSHLLTARVRQRAGPPSLGTTRLASRCSPRNIIILLLPFLVWILIFASVPVSSTAFDHEAQQTAGRISSWALIRVAVLGITLLALLSGGGAIAAFWDGWNSWKARRRIPGGATTAGVSDATLDAAERSFERARQELLRRRADLSRLEATVAAENEAAAQADEDGTGSRVGMLSNLGRFFGASRTTEAARELSSTRTEVGALESMAMSMRDELAALRERKREEEFNRTLGGKIWIAVGYAWAAYCAARIVLTCFSLLVLHLLGLSLSPSRSSSSPTDGQADFDPLSRALALFLRLIGNNSVDVELWTRQISLLLAGGLILSAVRYTMARLARAFKAANRGTATGAGSGGVMLWLAWIMSCYFLAALIQLRTSLPPRLSSSSSSPLSLLPHFDVVFGTLFDTFFVIGAAATFAVKWLGHVSGVGAEEGAFGDL